MPVAWAGSGRWGRFGPEAALAVVAALAALGFLGSTELWGRREQRAAAEAADTVDHGRWLVGQLQGRPRLEKPPLPRWVGAGLMRATGRRDEAIVRLPGALAALGLVALAYAWGRSAGGRAVGLAAGFALAATPSFLIEMRQAGVDGPLALCAALALWAALRRWGDWGEDEGESPGPVGWARAFWAAAGLGFLCKGPAIALWVAVPVAGSLLSRRRLGAGLRLLADPWGVAACAGLALAWPLTVAWHHPEAWGVWWLEVGQKTGGLGVEHGSGRGSILPGALGMTLPWAPLVVAALAGPAVRRWRGVDRPDSPALGLTWWWAFGPLAVLGAWDDPKPSYYLPALPAAAVLAGAGWVGLCRRARDLAEGKAARWALQLTWSGAFAAAVALPVAAHGVDPAWAPPAAAAGLALGAAALASARLWHRGRDAASLGVLASGLVGLVLIGYGWVAPGENAARGHRALADRLARDLPAGAPAWFLDDLDEGVWFYGPTLDLRPVPPAVEADAPATNRGHALRTSAGAGRTRAEVADARVRATVARLDAWADRAGPGATLLVRGKLLDRLAGALPARLAPVDREPGVRRNEVARLRVRTPAEVAAGPAARRRPPL